MRFVFLCSLLCLTKSLLGQDFRIGGSIEQTLWVSEDIPAAFLEFDDGVLYAPRVSLDFDYQPSEYFLVRGLLRADRGFDVGTRPDGQVRLDQLIARYRPFGDNRLNIQIGKFPTLVGNWVQNHQFHDDPFLLAPLPYAAIVGVNSNTPLQHSPAAIENRANTPGPTLHEGKTNWSALIWGPAYSNGLGAFGNYGAIDYALEVKNTFLGSTPDQWDFGEGDFREPTVSGRIGYSPSVDWALGLSASHGPYLNADSPSQFTRNAFNQTLVGADLRWSHRDWIISGEAFFANYGTLAEDLQTFSYYVQARYKAAPGLWFAGRFGQTVSNEITGPSGAEVPWNPDIIRAELALGWRITPDLLLKTQYTYTEVTNGLSAPARNLYGFSLGWKF